MEKSKNFRNYKNLIELFNILRDINVNPKEVLKNQNNFKSDLGRNKKVKSRFKLKDKICVMQNFETF